MVSSSTRYSVLVVDDEPEIRALVKRYFEKERFEVFSAADGPEMRQVMSAQSIDLVILDVHLPGQDGFALAAELRRTCEVAIVMLTAKSDLVDKIAGLESGADDYIPKPFDLRELLARSRAVLRRTKHEEHAPGFAFAGWKVNTVARELQSPDGRVTELSPAEFDLLIVLLENPNRVLTRDMLLHKTRGRITNPFDRTIDVRIGQIRKRIEPDPSKPTFIRTVRNAGYVFTPSVEHL